jgi:hypothetical protein
VQEANIGVTKSEQIATYRQTITPQGAESVTQIATALLRVYRANKITGTITFHMNQGGVRNIIADQTARVPEGGEADAALEALFGR